MSNGLYLIDSMSVQDRDLLTRLTQYFDALETRLAQGQGWFIFNAGGSRARWVTQFIQARLREYAPLVSYFVMPWRDVALNAYMTEIELPARAETPAVSVVHGEDRQQLEYGLARRVSRATGFHMRQCDMLVMTGVRPAHPHELAFLDSTVGERYVRRRATIFVTPLTLTQLGSALGMLEGGAAFWERLWTITYERSLIAL